MALFKLYALIRVDMNELIGIYETEKDAKEAKREYTDSTNEDEFYIDYDFITL